MIKRYQALLLVLLIGTVLFAQERYSIKTAFYGGKIIPTSKSLESTAKRAVVGGEIAIEFLPQGDYQWEQFWNYPTWGIGMLFLDMGNPQILGQSVSLYPYLMVPMVYNKHFELNYKIGGGVSFFTKTWNNNDTLSGINAPTANPSIGSVMNVYLTTGFNMEFYLIDGFAAYAEVGYSHMSNGNVLQPNGGINMFYGQLGAKYYINWQDHRSLPRKNPSIRLPYDFAITAVVSGGTREHYYMDNRSYPVASVHIGAVKPLSNIYALGGGLDLFYDGVFVQQGVRGSEHYQQHTKYQRYFIDNESINNKFRLGLSINNELIIGRVIALLDWGIYLWNPIRNANPLPHKKYGYQRPMFYNYNIDKEDGWNYFRLGARVRVWDNLYLQVAIKTHLKKAEMIEFGFGYRLPFMKSNPHGSMSRSGFALYHPDREKYVPFPTPWIKKKR